MSSLTLTDSLVPFIYTGTLPIDPPQDAEPEPPGFVWQGLTAPLTPISGRHSERAFRERSEIPLTVGAIRYLNQLSPRLPKSGGRHRVDLLDDTVNFSMIPQPGQTSVFGELAWPVEARRPTWRQRWSKRLHRLSVRLIKEAHTQAIRKTLPLPVSESDNFTLAWG